MFKKSLLSITVICIAISTSFAQKHEDIQKIKNSYIKLILYENRTPIDTILWSLTKETDCSDRMVVELMERYKIDESEINAILKGLNEDNTWSDIDYTSQNRSSWPTKNHTTRILMLSKAYKTKGTPFYNNPTVAQTIHRALSYWFEKKPICVNWWYNNVGVPRTLGEAFLLFEDEMTPEEKVAAIEVMKKAKIGMTGQNRVWLAGNTIIRAILQDNIELAREGRNVIIEEIVEGNHEGIKTDRSFHQHGPQQQFGNYGMAYIGSMSFWANVFHDTQFEIEQDKLNIISTLINEGFRKVLWKGYLDVNGLGRQFFKQAQHHKGLSAGLSMNMLLEVDAENSNKYQTTLNENYVKKPKIEDVGVYHFWQSDFTVARHSEWMASVKMCSDRVIGTESGNGDNMKGYHLADGALYTYVTGNEYHDIFPTWNWRKIPGITCYDTDEPLKMVNWESGAGGTSFVGNVNNGRTGITSMNFEKDGLKAHKSWIFRDDYILCMGTAIASDSEYPVITTIEQSHAYDSELTKIQSDKKDKTARFHHLNKGYIIFPNNNDIEANITSRSGLWNDIMQIYPNEGLVTNKVLTITVSHGTKPNNGRYQYLIIPNTSRKQVANFDLKKIKTICLDSDLQAIMIDKNTYYIAAYKPCNIELSKGIQFMTDSPGLFLIESQEKGAVVYLSDPTQQLDNVTLKLNDITKTIPLPQGNMKGKSIEVKF